MRLSTVNNILYHTYTTARHTACIKIESPSCRYPFQTSAWYAVI